MSATTPEIRKNVKLFENAEGCIKYLLLTFNLAVRSFLRSLFSSAPSATGEWQPFALTATQATQHAQWVAGHIYRNWLGRYFKSYHLHRGGAGRRHGLRAEPLREEGRQGAMLFYDDEDFGGPGNFRHLYEYMGDQMVALGYHRACADECTRRHESLREHTLKQLFKPPPTDCPESGYCDQRYGLVTLDLVSLNGQPLFIRVAVNPVLEPGFTPATPFEVLMRAMFDAPLPTPEEQESRLAYKIL